MKNDQKDFPLLERLMVVAILLVVATIGIEDLLHSVKQSEEHTVLAAAAEYSALRNTYAEQYRAVPSGAFGVNTTGTANPFNTPVH
jgi:Tfp pilus assembly protein PilE